MKWPRSISGLLLFFLLVTTSFGQRILSYEQVNSLAQQADRPDMVGVRALYQRYGYGCPQSFKGVEDGISFANAKHPFCLYNLAIVLSNRGDMASNPLDGAKLRDQAEHLFAAAVPGMVSLSNQGDPYAKFMLGGLFESGHGGIPIDLHQAAELYKASSDAGLPLASHNLASLMIRGKVSGKTQDQGIRLLYKAALDGVPVSMFFLGQMYIGGDGLPRNVGKGVATLLNAATLHNHGMSQFELAKIYLEGKYGLSNKNEGAIFLQRAVENLCSDAVVYARKTGASLPDYTTLPQVDILLLQEFGSKMLPVYSTLPNQNTYTPAQSSSITPSIQQPQKDDPEAEKIQLQFSKKSTSVVTRLVEAISEQVKSDNPSVAAAALKLDPAGGKASDWIETAFASEIAQAKQNPSYAAVISTDQAFATSSLDLLQILPLVKEKRYTDASNKVSDYLNPTTPVSKGTLEGTRASLQPLQALLSDQIKQSDKLREQSSVELSNNHYDKAIDLLSQAMKIDLRADDSQKISQYQKDKKSHAFNTELGL